MDTVQPVKTEPSKSFNFLDLAGKATAPLSGMALLLSVFYDYSFLSALGLQFSEVPTTISDHLRSAIVWLPGLLAAVAFLALYELLTRTVEGFRTEDELVRGSPGMRKFRQSPQYLFFGFVALLILHAVFLSTSESSYYLLFFLVWGLVSTTAIGHSRLRPKFTVTTALSFVLLPMLVAWVGWLGYTRGEALLSSKPHWRVMLKMEEEVRELHVSGIRRFSTAVVLVSTDRGAIVVPDSHVVSASPISGPSPRKSGLCKLFGVFCATAAPK